MKSIWQTTLGKIRDGTASNEPIVTSGAISIIVAVYACSLVRMALILSSKRTRGKRRWEKIRYALEKLEQSSSVLSRFADEDIIVFQGFLDAFGMPVSVNSEKKQRSKTIRARRLESIQVPLESAAEIMKILGIIHEVIIVCSGNLLCDLAVAANMLESSVLNLSWCVKENGHKLNAEEQSKLTISMNRLVSESRSELKSINDKISTLDG